VWKWCDESILTALWFRIKQLIFDLKVRQWQSAISTVSVLCKLFKIYAHQIWAYSTTKQSSLYLLYKINLQLSDDSNNLWSLRETDFEDQLKQVEQIQTVWVTVNEIFLQKTIKLKMIHNKTVQLSTTKKEDWMLIQNEESQKFKAKWFESYKILKTHLLKTYALEMFAECVLQNLIYSNWLIKAYIFNVNEFWANSELQSSLKWAKLSVQWLSLKVDEILKQKESSLSFYKELLIISWVKWDHRQKKELYKLLIKKKEDLS